MPRPRRKAEPAAPPESGALPTDPVAFLEGVLVNPETGGPFVLTEAERAFLAHAFAVGPDGRALYPELVFGAPKKSGKTALAAMVLIYVVRVLGGRFAEGYVISNSREQAANRVFLAAARIVEATPALAAEAKVTAEKIVFGSTGATIAAIASDYATAAGSNPTISVFDELWGFTTELDHRLFDEMVVPPTRALGWRLTVTYAGYHDESELLEGLYSRGMAGEQVAPDLYAQPGLLMFWTHRFTAPWQTEAWREQMREALRPKAYLRLIENRWISSESSFVPIEWFDECVDATIRPLIREPRLPVWVGVDASTKRDTTAVVACTWDGAAQKVRLVRHAIWQPSPDDPLDFETTVEVELMDLARRFALREVRYDPFQMQATAERLRAARLPMLEFPQTAENLTAASTGLYELLKGRNLAVYPDEAIRQAVQRSVAVEMKRGWRLAKARASHPIDVVVALAMASYGAVQASMGPAALASVEDLLGPDGAPLPMPKICELLHAVLIAGADGSAAAMYFAAGHVLRSPPWVGVLLLDFDDIPLGDAPRVVYERLFALFRECGCGGQGFIHVQREIEPIFLDYGLAPRTINAEWIRDPQSVAVSVAAYVHTGRVRICERAYEKSRRLPLGGTLVFHGDTGKDALRLAWLMGVKTAMGD